MRLKHGQFKQILLFVVAVMLMSALVVEAYVAIDQQARFSVRP